jgi:NAD(P)-dependent dehydrogenase (short-subunit alcohol dehydrogenase family)
MTIHQQPPLRVAVTGGTSGLGLALVRQFLACGAQVAFVARSLDRLEQIADQHPGAHPIAGDVSVKHDIYRIALQITGALGGLNDRPSGRRRGSVIPSIQLLSVMMPHRRKRREADAINTRLSRLRHGATNGNESSGPCTAVCR